MMSNKSSQNASEAQETTVYVSPNSFDRVMEENTAREKEQNFENCVKEGKEKKESDVTIALRLVGIFLSEHSYSATGRIVSAVEACAELIHDSIDSEDIRNPSYWSVRFDENPTYAEAFWEESWENNRKNGEVSKYIPDNPIDRFVLHFLRGWREKLHGYIVDNKIAKEERAAVLKIQVENFAFFSRKKPFGGLWKMYSESNDWLQQAIDAEGAEVPAHDDKGNPVRTISNRTVQVRADKNISPSAASSPKPDEVDIDIYYKIVGYADTKLKLKVHQTWTLVKSTFQKEGVTHRCYAFSGRSDSKKELKNVPTEWWEKHRQEIKITDNQEIKITDVDQAQFGHKLVLILIQALKLVILEDFKKLARHVAFEEYSEAEVMILQGRRDISVLHYGFFYDYVVGVINKYDEKIKRAVSGKLKSDPTQLLHYTRVSNVNKKFAPHKEEIEKILSTSKNSDKVNSICEISKQILEDLKKDLDELPNKFLETLLKQLQQSQCGEDNVIRLTLQELLELKFDCLLNVVVKFVAMDAKAIRAKAIPKPFCKVCALKVPFYSVLPQLLREIGSTGDDFDELAHLLDELAQQRFG